MLFQRYIQTKVIANTMKWKRQTKKSINENHMFEIVNRATGGTFQFESQFASKIFFSNFNGSFKFTAGIQYFWLTVATLQY